MPPYLAKVLKDKMGHNFLIQCGWNLSEAHALRAKLSWIYILGEISWQE
jgi:hypothetical protein